MWQLCFWCHSLQQSTPPLQKHTHSESLGLPPPHIHSFSPIFFFSIQPSTILPQKETGTLIICKILYHTVHTHKYSLYTCCLFLVTVCKVCHLHISARAHNHIFTQRGRERGRVVKWSADLCFGSFWMETFVQLSCLLLCQSGQCFNYKMRGETFI